MSSVLLVLIVGFLNLLSFYFGAKLSNNKENFTINPVELHKKHIEYIEEQSRKDEYKKQEEEMKINFENIDNYDGTELGQKNFD